MRCFRVLRPDTNRIRGLDQAIPPVTRPVSMSGLDAAHEPSIRTMSEELQASEVLAPIGGELLGGLVKELTEKFMAGGAPHFAEHPGFANVLHILEEAVSLLILHQVMHQGPGFRVGQVYLVLCAEGEQTVRAAVVH